MAQLIYSRRFLIDVFQLSLESPGYDFSFFHFWQDQRPRINVKAGNLIFTDFLPSPAQGAPMLRWISYDSIKTDQHDIGLAQAISLHRSRPILSLNYSMGMN